MIAFGLDFFHVEETAAEFLVKTSQNVRDDFLPGFCPADSQQPFHRPAGAIIEVELDRGLEFVKQYF